MARGTSGNLAQPGTEEATQTERGAVLRRRGLLAGAAALAAGALAAKSSEAVRANGETVTIGTNIFGITAQTRLSGSTTGGVSLFKFTNFGDGAAIEGATSLNTPNAFGVVGSSNHNDGVVGATSGDSSVAGVRGIGIADGVGIRGTSSTGIGGSFQGGLAPLRLVPGPATSATLAPTGHQTGEFYVTSDRHVLFFDGTAWRQFLFAPSPSNPPPQPPPPQPPPPGVTPQPVPQPRSG
jgi:hypothetical protein